ncbi:glycoside hydrolase domain-containing protein [Nocardioides sp. SYSU DS0651]|uniref:glycoside hydrolase domain-containing protein n=1 Tax=Nocardioides sp. SYSU DS0651 TaxID=3415955 RepID=UPI003F4C7DAC
MLARSARSVRSTSVAPRLRPALGRAAAVTAITVVAVLAVALLAPLRAERPAQPAAPLDLSAAASGNPVTPGDFTGYGFDQCLAPTQAKMDAWHEHSPFMSVGIYISGNSRHCRSQPNLTPTWVSTQLRKGWRLLPITLGPQASCSARYPKYGARIDPTISPDSTRYYAKAKAQAKAEAEKAVSVATSLGIVKGSTLFYDLEAFDITQTHCRESAIRFVHAWTVRLHQLGYRSGYYSSAGSGIKMIDQARIQRPGAYVLPDYLWIARWDGKANTSVSSAYLTPTAWTPHKRVKQYQGGHDEKWGGVTINIDRNYLDVGRGSVATKQSYCGGVRIDLQRYYALSPTTRPSAATTARVKALQCLLTMKRLYSGPVDGDYDSATQAAAKAWQRKRGFSQSSTWSVRNWMSILSYGARPVLKVGSTGEYVRRAQRAVQAAVPSYELRVTGVFDAATAKAVKAYRSKVGIPGAGIVNTATWNRLRAGRR